MHKIAPTVKKLFPKTNGLFTKINFDFDVSKSLLDILFIGNFGMKNPSPFVMTIHDDDETQLTQEELTLLADSLLALYSNKWTRLKAMQDSEYDPLHNYLDEWEDHSEGWNVNDKDVTSTRTDTLNTLETTQSTRTDNLMKTTTLNELEGTTDSQSDSIHGFNSATAVPTDNSSGTGSKTTTGTDTEANTGTQGVTKTVADTGTTSRQFVEQDGESGSDNRDREGFHRGNIGNITTQKMIKEEIELWKWKYINEVLSDVSDFCTLPIYLNFTR